MAGKVYAEKKKKAKIIKKVIIKKRKKRPNKVAPSKLYMIPKKTKKKTA